MRPAEAAKPARTDTAPTESDTTDDGPDQTDGSSDFLADNPVDCQYANFSPRAIATRAARRLAALLAIEEDGTKAAALSKELRAVLADIDKLAGTGVGGGALDEIEERRAARRATAESADAPAVPKRGRRR